MLGVKQQVILLHEQLFWLILVHVVNHEEPQMPLNKQLVEVCLFAFSLNGQKSEIQSSNFVKSEVWSLKYEVGSRKPEVGSRKSEVGSQKSEDPPRLSYYERAIQYIFLT